MFLHGNAENKEKSVKDNPVSLSVCVMIRKINNKG